ncbi:MAG: hypothetical protein K8R90_11750 [Candidatus Cloacimonetes bacterium]|nr:hypothetical protein [Candidatus Cloacimonadota bacterium]
MSHGLQVQSKHIKNLDEKQLVTLLRMLLNAEALRFGIPLSNIHVPDSINVADGGIDGSILSCGFPPDGFLKNRNCFFQVKARARWTPSQTKKELLQKGNLKPRLEEVLSETDAGYYLFLNVTMQAKTIDKHLQAIIEVLSKDGIEQPERKAHVFDAKKIAAWSNHYPLLKAWVYEKSGFPQHVPYRSYTQERERFARKNSTSVSFETTERLVDYQSQLKEAVQSQKISSIILAGPPGIGKSRFILEWVRQMDEETASTGLKFSTACVFMEADSIARNRIDYIQMNNIAFNTVFIVDNITIEVFESLKTDLHNGNFLLGIAPDYLHESHYTGKDYRILQLKPENMKPVVITMVENALRPNDHNCYDIIRFSGGFPLMAVLMLDRASNGEPFAQLGQNDLALRVLGLKKGDDGENCITALALFNSFGYEDEVADEFKDIIGHTLLSLTTGGFDYERGRKICDDLTDRGILEKRGRFRSFRPVPVMLQLVENWWERVASRYAEVEDFLKYLHDRTSSGGRHTLLERFCQQIELLSWCEHPKRFVNNALGADSPFVSLEVLSTAWGARLFHSFCYVAPQKAAATSFRLFSNLGIPQLREIKDGRSYLVWALEAAAWHEDAYFDAARAIFWLALGENQSYSNNATGLLLQSFHLHLPGTKADLQERLKVVQYMLRQWKDTDIDCSGLIMQAIMHGLPQQHYTRTHTHPFQNANEDFFPNYIQVTEYIEELLSILEREFLANEKYFESAFEKFSQNMDGLVSAGLLAQLKRVIDIIADKLVVNAPLIESLENLIRYRKEESWRQQIELWIDELKPSDWIGRFRLYVKQELGSVSFLEERTESEFSLLIDELKSDSSLLQQHLGDILSGRGIGSDAFGKKLFDIVEDTSDFIQACLDETDDWEEAPDIYLLAGFLNASTEQTLWEQALDGFIQRNHPDWAIELLTHKATLIDADIEKYLPLVEHHPSITRQFAGFIYGSVTKHVSPQMIVTMVKCLAEQSDDGAWIGLEILSMHELGRHDKKKRYGDYQPFLQEFVLMDVFLASPPVNASMSTHALKEILVWLVRNIKDDEYQLQLAKKCLYVVFRPPESPYATDDRFEDYMKAVALHRFPVFWTVIKDYLLKEEGDFWIREMLGNHLHDHDAEGLLFRQAEHYDTILDWCKQNGTQAQKNIAYIMPVYKLLDYPKLSTAVLHPFCKLFLLRFHSPDVIHWLSMNLGSFGFSGSIVHHFRMHQDVYRQLEAFGEEHNLSELIGFGSQLIREYEQLIQRETRESEEKWI